MQVDGNSAGDGQLKTRSNRYVLQLGGDIAQWSTDGLDRWHLGVQVGDKGYSDTQGMLGIKYSW